MNLLLEQMIMHRGATQHLAHLAMHSAGSMTRDELVRARAVFDEVCADMVRIDDAFLEFEPPVVFQLMSARVPALPVIESGFDDPAADRAITLRGRIDAPFPKSDGRRGL